jgi:hypothetical protein
VNARLVIRMCETPTACAGAAASYVLRRTACCAGAFAPGIHESIFHELHSARYGRTIDDVERWLADRAAALHLLGYGFACRRVASPTRDLLAWIEGGGGYRGAVLATSYEALHPSDVPGGEVGGAVVHAIGVVSEGGDITTIDPWSRAGGLRRGVDPQLERAHADRGHQALELRWVALSA